ncbi:hypothetical protein DAPK24_039630 [Pichia kluyveri]|uniref:Uncharacterized protein n=1 Tax=Pichia kluyveri TaxID=36015 RepID=A0AAV5R7L2_PICKL|nr:hypothetical protein DAPK24_039630 [Pichia kluyveri]
MSNSKSKENKKPNGISSSQMANMIHGKDPNAKIDEERTKQFENSFMLSRQFEARTMKSDEKEMKLKAKKEKELNTSKKIVDSFASRLAKKLEMEEQKEKAKPVSQSAKTSVKSESKIRTKADAIKKSEPDPADGFARRLEQKLKLAEQKQAQNASKSTNTAGTSTAKTNEQKIIDNKNAREKNEKIAMMEKKVREAQPKPYSREDDPEFKKHLNALFASKDKEEREAKKSGSNASSKKGKLTMPKSAKYTEESLQRDLAEAYQDLVQERLQDDYDVDFNMELEHFGEMFAFNQVICFPSLEIKMGDENFQYLKARGTQYYKEQQKLEDEKKLKTAGKLESKTTVKNNNNNNNNKKEIKPTSNKQDQKTPKQEPKKVESKKKQEVPVNENLISKLFSMDDKTGKATADKFTEVLEKISDFTTQENYLRKEKKALFREFSVPANETAEAKKIREKKEDDQEEKEQDECRERGKLDIMKANELIFGF